MSRDLNRTTSVNASIPSNQGAKRHWLVRAVGYLLLILAILSVPVILFFGAFAMLFALAADANNSSDSAGLVGFMGIIALAAAAGIGYLGYRISLKKPRRGPDLDKPPKKASYGQVTYNAPSTFNKREQPAGSKDQENREVSRPNKVQTTLTNDQKPKNLFRRTLGALFMATGVFLGALSIGLVVFGLIVAYSAGAFEVYDVGGELLFVIFMAIAIPVGVWFLGSKIKGANEKQDRPHHPRR